MSPVTHHIVGQLSPLSPPWPGGWTPSGNPPPASGRSDSQNNEPLPLTSEIQPAQLNHGTVTDINTLVINKKQTNLTWCVSSLSTDMFWTFSEHQLHIKRSQRMQQTRDNPDQIVQKGQFRIWFTNEKQNSRHKCTYKPTTLHFLYRLKSAQLWAHRPPVVRREYYNRTYSFWRLYF